jgi:hypothetical protein
MYFGKYQLVFFFAMNTITEAQAILSEEAIMSGCKKIALILIIWTEVFLFLFSCKKEPFSDAGKVKMMISSAMTQAREGDAAESIQSVFAALLMTLPQTGLPAEMGNLINQANEALMSGGFPNQEVTKYVLAAYRVMKPSFAGFGKMDESSEVSSIAGHYATKLREAEVHVDEGRPKDVVESLLEAVLLTSPITPQEK